MKVLGLSYGYHDSSAALVVDGELISFSTEERFTRQKHDAFFPQFAIESCLQKANLTKKDIDKFVYYEKSEIEWSRVFSSSLRNWPFNRREFTNSMKSWLGGKLWNNLILNNRLEVADRPIESFEHHLSHAAQAFIGSGFSDSAILTVDAVGEWESCTLYEASWKEGKPQFKKIISNEYPHSLGLFYSAITDFLGFKPMNDECSTMALAAFGTDSYVEEMKNVINVNEKGVIELNSNFLNFDSYFKKPYGKKFQDTFGAPGDGHYSFDCQRIKKVSGNEQRLADIAFAAQKIYEEIVLKLAHLLKNKTQSENLCLAGGGALNCVANSKILEQAGFKNLSIPKDPGDGGAAIGAAFLGYFQDQTHQSISQSYPTGLGQNYSTDSFSHIIDHLTPSKLQKFRKIGNSYSSGITWSKTHYTQDKKLVDEVAKFIKEGLIIGWFQGGTEVGPRALGQRSILFKPDDIEVSKRVSNFVKSRASYRPYALSMDNETAKRILVSNRLEQTPFRYMQLAIPIQKEFQQGLCAGLHIDETTRPQIVTHSDNPKFHMLLQTYGKLNNNLSCFINTSFNESGYPIVESPAEALLMFARTDMDILILGNTLIKKEKDEKEN